MNAMARKIESVEAANDVLEEAPQYGDGGPPDDDDARFQRAYVKAEQAARSLPGIVQLCVSRLRGDPDAFRMLDQGMGETVRALLAAIETMNEAHGGE